jgi:hypothetical protein
MVTFSIDEKYWESFKLQDEDIEFLYNHLLELETPLTTQELLIALVEERINSQRIAIEKERTSGGDLYQPKDTHHVQQRLIFPAFGWSRGQVSSIRPGQNPDLGDFKVVQVKFDDGSIREFASNLQDHFLNQPLQIVEEFDQLDKQSVLDQYGDELIDVLEESLTSNSDFVRIAGRWFPRAILVDINVGHLNLAEAVLDEAGGGPLPTSKILEQIELAPDVNPKLVEFSLDLSLQDDQRFDEVGPAGDVLWFLRRNEPEEVLEPPIYLRYNPIEYDRSLLTEDMLALERNLDDELTPSSVSYRHLNEGEVHLIFPHWRAGTLPLSSRIRHLFPTAYEAPRIRFMLVDGDTEEEFPGWVVREKRYVHGLRDWFEKRGVMPGSVIHLRKGKKPGQVIVQTDNRRPSREWIRTVLVGSDGGIVFAMLKQVVSGPFDERMVIAIPDEEALSDVWVANQKRQIPFERIVVNTVKELAKLNPQSHVHASELYAAVNVIRRCPPGPILSLLASRPWFTHVGDLHYRLSDSESDD